MMNRIFIGVVLGLALTSSALAAQKYCGRIKSFPDGYEVITKGGKIFFAGDNSAPPDPKGIYGYLNTHGSDADHSCYCISGTASGGRFTAVSGLSKCGGGAIK